MLLLCLILDVALLAYTWHCHNPNSKMQATSDKRTRHKTKAAGPCTLRVMLTVRNSAPQANLKKQVGEATGKSNSRLRMPTSSTHTWNANFNEPRLVP